MLDALVLVWAQAHGAAKAGTALRAAGGHPTRNFVGDPACPTLLRKVRSGELEKGTART